MLVNFFHVLKDTGVPVTPRELLDLLEAMEQRLAFGDMDDFYSLSRAILVKDEKYYDRFDRAFGLHFQDLEALDDVIELEVLSQREAVGVGQPAEDVLCRRVHPRDVLAQRHSLRRHAV